MESFLKSLFRLNRDDEILLLLSQVMTNEHHVSPPPTLKSFNRKIHVFALRSRWHDIFPRSLSSSISYNNLQATLLVSSIIKLSLSTLHRSWLKRCEMVHAALSRDT